MLERIGKDTAYVTAPQWAGDAFADSDAQSFWLRMPSGLRAVAMDEIENGNLVRSILHNETRDIVVLVFAGPPVSSTPPAEIRVHTHHEYGNYCYDDTLCTYEDLESGCFLSFDDPDYVDQS